MIAPLVAPKSLEKSVWFAEVALRMQRAIAVTALEAAACSLASLTERNPNGSRPKIGMMEKLAMPRAKVTSTSEKAATVFG